MLTQHVTQSGRQHGVLRRHCDLELLPALRVALDTDLHRGNTERFA